MPAAAEFDCLIIGGGMVGTGLAHALGSRSLRVALVEAHPVREQPPPSYDDRGLVMAPASRRILEGLGLWQGLRSEATPVERIHISDRGNFGFTRLEAREFGFDALGHVVIARMLGNTLLSGLADHPTVEFICPAQARAVDIQPGHVEVTLSEGLQGRKVTARLLVVADGGNSKVRESLGIGTEQHDYGQTVVVATVTPERPHDNTAYERFTPTGPLALLPMSEQRCVAVWTVATAETESLMALDDASFLEGLGERFGRRLGKFIQTSKRRTYPLHLITAREQVGERFAIIGNAAHTIHPNGAQGLNLGLRDIATLAELVCDAMQDGEDPGGEKVLKMYAKARRHDQRQVIRFSDGLARLFYNDFPMAIVARDLAMLAVDLIPPIKRALILRAMGLSGHQPRLVCGLPL